jgi:Na+/H+ antiporter NhaD/arsenite permease-like protein
MLLEYVSFIMLLFALYTVAGGIVVTGQIRATPWSNTAMLAVGAVAASFIGTTGASMILIRPMIRANDERPYNVHVFVFFIFLVSNIGGSLTPLGDPPLFVGFLRGVDFFWTMQHMLPETTFLVVILLVLFFAVDWWFWRREPRPVRADTTPPQAIGLRGGINVVLLGAIIAAVLGAAAWKPNMTLHVPGADLALENIARDIALLAIAFLSLVLTPREHRDHNAFTWEPIAEVAKLFAAIFICVIPVLAMLNAGRAGPFAWLLGAVTTADGAPHVIAYFWLTGILSAFLDNAPTYLVFFELAGGHAQTLMTELALALTAVSSGAVFMGALSYIGNAPNFMVYAIAVERGIKMPSFFGYMVWSFLILLPLFGLLTLFFFTVS